MHDIQRSPVFVLCKANQRVTAFFTEEFRPYGITPSQFVVLTVLWETDALTQIELSKRTGIDRTTIGGIIDRLEKSGFLLRQPSPEDRRAHNVMLTKRGRGHEELLTAAVSRARKRIAALITPEEYNQLQQLLGKLLL